MGDANRRRFIKVAAFSGSGLIGSISATQRSLAGTWQKVLTGGNGNQTWQRLQEASVPKFLIQRIFTTGSATFAVMSNGNVFACGTPKNGELGAGDTLARSTFIQISNISPATLFAGHPSYTAMVSANGAVFAAGRNNMGQIGNGTTIDRSTFVQAVGISGVVQIAHGENRVLVLTASGTIYGTGRGGFGLLGDNSVNYRSTFVSAIGISEAKAVACGYEHNVALRADGAVYSSGRNLYSQLGAGGGAPSSARTYIQSVGISAATAIACSRFSTSALRSDGTVFGAGDNSAGQIGDNSTATPTAYVMAIGVSNVIAIAAGTLCHYALRSDGLLFSTGSGANSVNNMGALGLNDTLNRSTYVQATGISNCVAMAAGDGSILAMRSDGLVFACGYIGPGLVGDGSPVTRSTFVEIYLPN